MRFVLQCEFAHQLCRFAILSVSRWYQLVKVCRRIGLEDYASAGIRCGRVARLGLVLIGGIGTSNLGTVWNSLLIRS
jgi:hypothetical protein